MFQCDLVTLPVNFGKPTIKIQNEFRVKPKAQLSLIIQYSIHWWLLFIPHDNIPFKHRSKFRLKFSNWTNYGVRVTHPRWQSHTLFLDCNTHYSKEAHSSDNRGRLFPSLGVPQSWVRTREHCSLPLYTNQTSDTYLSLSLSRCAAPISHSVYLPGQKVHKGAAIGWLEGLQTGKRQGEGEGRVWLPW